ncbi:hybrid sensor histidine kinase/response regulator [Azospirillum sp. TSO22-1]|uniref:ATP-binding response regulator n=1 Tax=Azospirillum sp. TSO22-1 TaxID=716789 RepID=UPI000D618255|nr:hybrid sensor histidine kinase/response regulator [Azospirillum sp. TSO22-1]PWC53065.1 histidine kinase [Azospirillum sp. TSO22-1]
MDGGGNVVQEPLLVFDRALRLVAWNAAAQAFPALAGALAEGASVAALDERLAGVPVRDARLADGGLVRTLGAAPGLSADRGSRLFAAASHDLRQPLAALSLLVGALDGRVGEPAARDVLRSMAAAVQSMKTMVDGHFDLVRLQAGLLEPEVGRHAVNGILTRLALDFAPRFEARRLRFSVLPCSAMVETDATLLERILHALLANALRHTERGRVLLGCRRRGGELRIEVWDSGRGVPSDQLALLRAELARPPGDEQSGSVLGLGLTLAGGLAQRLGHRIEVDSVPGRCSRFSVIVRLVPDQEEDPAAPPLPEAEAEADVSRARVLVIEDDRLVLDALGVLLGQWGCAVIGAESFDDAMEVLGPDPQAPDLIIADLRLKGAANGIVAIRQIAKALGTAMPGLILTGDTDPKRLREARLSGYPLLHKPVAPLALRTALANLLGRERLRP